MRHGSEAWRIGAAGESPLAARVTQAAYLGSTRDYVFDTTLGAIFVIATHADSALAVGQEVSLDLAHESVAVVPGSRS